MATNAEGTNNEAVGTGLVAGYVRTAGVGDDAHSQRTRRSVRFSVWLKSMA